MGFVRALTGLFFAVFLAQGLLNIFAPIGADTFRVSVYAGVCFGLLLLTISEQD